MTTVMDGHIVVDENGVARVGKTRMKVTHLVMSIEADAMTPQQAVEQFPLTLADVHAALAYYHDHRDQVDDQIRQIDERVDRFAAEHPNPFTRAELERRLASRGGPS